MNFYLVIVKEDRRGYIISMSNSRKEAFSIFENFYIDNAIQYGFGRTNSIKSTLEHYNPIEFAIYGDKFSTIKGTLKEMYDGVLHLVLVKTKKIDIKVFIKELSNCKTYDYLEDDYEEKLYSDSISAKEKRELKRISKISDKLNELFPNCNIFLN